VLLVVASRYDETAAGLVAHWSAHDAALVTPADLSSAGWGLSLGDCDRPSASVGGRVVGVDEIRGVLTRLPGVWDAELVDIDPGDRAYVAAEMTAFLLAWLTDLECPVVNPPTPGCLSGPYWRPEQWLAAAAEVGMAILPLTRTSDGPSSRNGTTPPGGVAATVVGERVLGEVEEPLAVQARELARLAHVALLEVRFGAAVGGSYFLGAEPWPDLGVPEVADAVLELLTES
jgi:hypothetical protein